MALTAKSVLRLARGPVVRRLRGAVDHRVDFRAKVLEQGVQRGTVANVEFMVTIAAQVPFQPVSVHPGACLGTKECPTHVVVDPDNLPIPLGEQARSL